MVRSKGFVTRERSHKRKKFYGKYKGFVADTEDPEERGRIKAIVPKVLGKDIETEWALPCVMHAGDDFGQEYVPNEGEGVWIEFEQGNIENPIWVGQWWADEEYDLQDIRKDFEYEDDVEYLRRISTDSGIKLTFFDREDEEYAELLMPSGHKLMFDDEEGQQQIFIEDNNGNIIQIDTEEDDLNIEINNDSNQKYGGDLNITVEGQTNLECDDINIGDETLGMLSGVATEEFVYDLFQVHTHIGNLGNITSPPIEPIVDILHITQETEIS